MAGKCAELRWAPLILVAATVLLGLTIAMAAVSNEPRPAPTVCASTDACPRAATAAKSGPVIGANYTHYEITPACDLGGSGILATYHLPGIRAEVLRQLEAMHEAGVESLRLLVWHQPEALAGQDWGVIQSIDGMLAEPYRTNLELYASDLRRSGFGRLTVALAPTGSADPRRSGFAPADLERNWRVLTDVRTIATRAGPETVLIDLLNDGPPGLREPERLQAQVGSYLTEIYARYSARWGAGDVSVSIIASQTVPDAVYRMAAFIEAVTAAEADYPRRFDVHLSYDPVLARAILGAVEDYLTGEGLAQPLVVSEMAYESSGVARTLAEYDKTSPRALDEVIAWPLTRDRPCSDISVEPPYRVDRYRALLRGETTPRPGGAGTG